MTSLSERIELMKSILLAVTVLLLAQTANADAYLDYLARQSRASDANGRSSPTTDLLESYSNEARDREQQEHCWLKYNTFTNQYEKVCQ